jgi:hypothetical protein
MWLPSKEIVVHVDRFMHYIYRPALHGILEATDWIGGLYNRQYIPFFILLTILSLRNILLVPVLTTSFMKELQINTLKPRGSTSTI